MPDSPAPRPPHHARGIAIREIISIIMVLTGLGLLAYAVVRPRGGPPAVSEISVVTPDGAAGPAVWRTGDAFAVRVTLSSPAQPVVFYVDPTGHIELLHPDSSTASLSDYEPGSYVLPPVDSGLLWSFAGEPGPETFLATAVGPDADLPKLHREITAAAMAPSQRENRVSVLASALKRFGRGVVRTDIEHGPAIEAPAPETVEPEIPGPGAPAP